MRVETYRAGRLIDVTDVPDPTAAPITVDDTTLRAQVEQLQAQVEQLQAQVEQLQETP